MYVTFYHLSLQSLTRSLATTAPAPGSLISITPSPSSSATPAKSKSKAWIAGVVVGPILGIALIAGIVFFLMRRNKSKNTMPQTGTASMGPSVGPPPGVTDAKPQMATNTSYGQPSPGFNPNDPYNQQGYAPASPAPQYSQPYPTPGSDPSQVAYGGAYAPDTKHAYSAAPSHPEAAELGGSSGTGPAAGQSHTAELPGVTAQPQR